MKLRAALLLCAAAAWPAVAPADYISDRGIKQPPEHRFLAPKLLRLYPARSSIGRMPGERNCIDTRTERACIERYGKPQERRTASAGKEIIVYFGPRQLYRGTGSKHVAVGRERTEHTVRAGQVVAEYQIIQVVEHGYSFDPLSLSRACEEVGRKGTHPCFGVQPLEPPPALERPPSSLVEGRSDKALFELYAGLLFEPRCERVRRGFLEEAARARAAGDPRDAALARWIRSSPDYVEDLAILSSMPDERDAEQLKEACDDMLAVLGGPDERFASPEKTWETYLSALRAGDGNAARACLAAEARRKFDNLEGMPDRLKAMAQAIKAMTMTVPTGEVREALVVRHDGRAGMVYFMQHGKNWKIHEM